MADADTWIGALAMHIASNGLGTLGSDLWVGRRSDDPSLPAKSMVLTEIPGAVDESFGGSNDVYRPMLAVYVRGAVEDYQVARQRIFDTYWLLTSILEVQIRGFRFLRVAAPNTTPVFLGRDANERPEFTCEFWTWQPRPTPKAYTYVP